MRRIVLLAVVSAIMAATMAVGALSVSAQPSPGDVHCGPWVRDWNISEGWWYFWWLRHCHNPATEEQWEIQWDGWEWWGPVG